MDNFVDVEFFQNGCTDLGKYLYAVYSLCGAICYEKFIRSTFKCFVIAFLCIAYLFCTIPPLKVLIRDPELAHNFDAIGILAFIHQMVVTMCLFFWKRKEFRRLLDLINENSHEPIPCPLADSNYEGDYIKETNIMKIIFRIIQGFILLHSMIYFSKISQKFFIHGSLFGELDEQSEFFIPFFCGTCNTALSYILAYNLSFLSLILFAIFHAGSLTLFFVFSKYLKNRAIGLTNDIKYYSDAAFERFEDLDRLEEQELKRRHPSPVQLRDIAQHRETQEQEFTNKIHRWIRIHQRLVECVSQYQECAKIILDLIIAEIWYSCIDLAFFCASHLLDDGNFIYQFYIYLVQQLLTLIICCSIGNVFDDMSEMISDAIYSTPWYYLPVKEQKVILNFLTLSQPIQTLTIFGIFSVNFELLPTLLNEIYGYVQIVRLLVMRRKN